PPARAPGVSGSGRMWSAMVATRFAWSGVSARGFHAPSGTDRASQPASTPAMVGAARTPPNKRAARRSASRRSITDYACCARLEVCAIGGPPAVACEEALAKRAPAKAGVKDLRDLKDKESQCILGEGAVPLPEVQHSTMRLRR